jgi:succinyl-diaminopimelate desuccinylase
LSLVPDDGFAVGYGGKGGLTLSVRSGAPLDGVTVTAGMDDAPGKATAVFSDGDTLIAQTPPRHGAKPDPNGNMITRLCERLLQDERIAQSDRPVIDLFRSLSLDVDGSFLGVATAHEALGNLTVFAKKVELADGCPSLVLNLRYPVGITCEQIVERVSNVVQPFGCCVCDLKRGVDPYLYDPQSDTVRLLCRIANSVTGENAAPHTLGGGTYAHRLPNAYPYGTDANVPPSDFEKGRGGAHGVDEAASVDRLLRAMRVYARTLQELDVHPEMFTISQDI